MFSFDFIKPYLHIVELIAAVALLGMIGYEWHAYNGRQQEIGATEIKQADDKALQQRLAEVALENGKLKVRAETAENAHDQELEDLRAYRIAHPVRPVWVSNSGKGYCIESPSSDTSDEQARGGNATGTGRIQQMPTGDTRPPGIDISPMLDALEARADQIVAQARECLNR